MLGPLEDALADATRRSPPTQRARLKLAHDNALRLLKLVNALLDFSRLEAGRLRASFAPVDLARVHRRARGDVPVGRRRGRPRARRRLPAAVASPSGSIATCGRRSSRTSSRTRSSSRSPARSRVRVARGDGARRARGGGHRHRHSRGRAADASSSASTASPARSAARTRARASACRWCASSSSCTAGASTRDERASGAGTTFRVEIPKGSAHLPADAVSQTPPSRVAPRRDPRRTRPKRRAGARRTSRRAASTAASRRAAPRRRRTARGPRCWSSTTTPTLREYIASAARAGLRRDAPRPTAQAALEAVRAQRARHRRQRRDDAAPRRLRPGARAARRPANGVAAGHPALRARRRGVRDRGSRRGLRRLPHEAVLGARAARARAHARRAGADAARVDRGARAREPRARRVQLLGVARPARAAARDRRLQPSFSPRTTRPLLDARGHGYLERIGRNVRADVDADRRPARARAHQRARPSRPAPSTSRRSRPTVVARPAHAPTPSATSTVEIAAGLIARGDRRLAARRAREPPRQRLEVHGDASRSRASSSAARPAHEPTFFVRDNGAGFDMAHAHAAVRAVPAPARRRRVRGHRHRPRDRAAHRQPARRPHLGRGGGRRAARRSSSRCRGVRIRRPESANAGVRGR